MTDRFVTVPDALELPAAVKVPVDRLHDSTVAGRALLTGADAAAQRTSLGLGDAAQHAHGGENALDLVPAGRALFGMTSRVKIVLCLNAHHVSTP